MYPSSLSYCGQEGNVPEKWEKYQLKYSGFMPGVYFDVLVLISATECKKNKTATYRGAFI